MRAGRSGGAASQPADERYTVMMRKFSAKTGNTKINTGEKKLKMKKEGIAWLLVVSFC